MAATYNIVSLIRKKRDRQILTEAEIDYVIAAYTAREIEEYQMSAMLMAIFLNGLNKKESAAFTRAMLNSGTVLDLSNIPGIKVDKHSTGGVGDKISLILAPIVAACGVPVPMISGRGLGHSGGTLDKLESIPGFNVNLDLQRYREVLKKHNMVLIGQTKEIAPADKEMYALRDVTATVECIPLIAGSIMSKKLAEGIDALVLDVKYGAGAFMKTLEQARELAEALVGIGLEFGKDTVAWLTAMEEPLGYKIGNWLEVEESIEALNGKGPADVMEVTHQLAATMIWQGGKTDSLEKGLEMSRSAVENGSALQKLIDIVDEQGGDSEVIRHPGSYPKATYSFDIKAPRAGYITALNAFEFGMASVELGAGRKRKEDGVDPVAGIVLKHKVGQKVSENETICTAFTNTRPSENIVRPMLEKAINIGDTQPKKDRIVTHVVDKAGFRPV